MKGRYQYLLNAVHELRPKRILEIGTFKGKRARVLIREAMRYGEVEYYGFDLFEPCPLEEFPKSKAMPSFEKIKAGLEKTGARIFLFRGNTRHSLAQANLPPMDLIFIDGGHSLETVSNDWDHCSQLMHKRTVVFFDDYWSRLDAGCKALVDNLQKKSNEYQVEILDSLDQNNTAQIRMARVMKTAPPESTC